MDLRDCQIEKDAMGFFVMHPDHEAGWLIHEGVRYGWTYAMVKAEYDRRRAVTKASA